MSDQIKLIIEWTENSSETHFMTAERNIRTWNVPSRPL